MGGSSSKKRRDLPCDLRTVSKFLSASKSCAGIQSPRQGGKALFNILLGRRRNSDQHWPFTQCAFSRISSDTRRQGGASKTLSPLGPLTHTPQPIRHLPGRTQNDGRVVTFRTASNMSKDVGGCIASGQRSLKLGGRGHSRMMAAAKLQHMQRVFIRSRVSQHWLTLPIQGQGPWPGLAQRCRLTLWRSPCAPRRRFLGNIESSSN